MFALLDAYSVAALTVSTCWRMRIYELLDTYCAVARYVSNGNAHRIWQHVDTYSAARQYASGRRRMLEGRENEVVRGGKLIKKIEWGSMKTQVESCGSVLSYAMINNSYLII